MNGSDAPGLPGGFFGGGLLEMFNVSLDKVIHKGKPNPGFGLT